MKWYRIKALLLKYFYITKNRFDRIFDIFYWPILDIVIWGFASAFIENISDVNVLNMIFGGIILWVFVWRSSQDIAVYVLEDFWSRNLYHLFSSPVTIFEHMTSIVILGFIRSLITFTFLVIVAFVFYSFNIFVFPIYYLAAGIAILTLFGWAMGIIITALIFRFGKRIQILAWSLVWIIQPFSCVFYPLSALPDWAQKIAILLPTTHVFELMRNVLFNNETNIQGLVYGLLSSLVLLAFAVWLIKISFESARKRGMLASAE